MPTYTQSMFICETCKIPQIVHFREQFCFNCNAIALRQRGSIQFEPADYICCLTRFDFPELYLPQVQEQNHLHKIPRCTTNYTTCKIHNCNTRGTLSDIINHAILQHTEHVFDLKNRDNSFRIPNGRYNAMILQYDRNLKQNEVYWLFMDTLPQREVELQKQVYAVVIHEGKAIPHGPDNLMIMEYTIANTHGVAITRGNIGHRMLEQIGWSHRHIYLAGYGVAFGDEYAREFRFKIRNESIPLTSQVRRQLSCIICNKIMDAPIKVCPKNHSMCEGCVPNNCPRCKTESVKFVRNHNLEEISSNVLIQCPHEYCMVSGPKCKVQDHDGCTYQPAACLMCDQEYIRYNTLYRHIQYRHLNSILHIECIMTANLDDHVNFWYVNGFNQVFGLTFIRENGKVIMGFHHLTNTNYTTYGFQLSIGTTPNTHENDKCLPITTDDLKELHSLVRMSSDSLSFPDFYECEQITDRLLKKGSTYQIVIKIGNSKKIKE